VNTVVTPSSPYLLDHGWEHESRRLGLLEQHADPTTIRRLRARGIAPGSRCLEVGAGRGSIARWLAREVGPAGEVVALDLDTSLLEDVEEPNVEVLCGDVLDVELAEGSFDLVHTRLVVMHIPERRRALERIVSLLAPGGVLLAEELDWMSLLCDPDPERVALWRGVIEAHPTIDFECGRAMLSELRESGLLDTGADIRVDVVAGATPLARLEQLTLLAVGERALDAGAATPEQLEAHLSRLDDPHYRGLGFSWIGAHGRSAPSTLTTGS
jgi:SAM-dependent methyltransferase